MNLLTTKINITDMGVTLLRNINDALDIKLHNIALFALNSSSYTIKVHVGHIRYLLMDMFTCLIFFL
jgi:hypothetical protein